jgi:hypothetical protein
LNDAIESDRFETIFVGRDGLTRILRPVPTATTAAPQPEKSEEQSEAELTKSAEEALGEAASAEDVLP